MLHYSPQSYEETSQILGLLSTTIWGAAYEVAPLIIRLPERVFREKDFPHAFKHKAEYMKLWNGEPVESGSRKWRSFVLAAIFSEYVWKKIQDGSIFTKEAREDLEEISKSMYVYHRPRKI